MKDPIAVSDLHAFLASGDLTGLKEACETVHPATVAESLSALLPSETWRVLGSLDPDLAAETFSHLDDDLQAELIASQSPEHVARLMAEMAPDDRADLVQAMDEGIRREVLPLLARAERENIRRLISYREGTAGAIMTTDYASLREDLTVAEALERLRHEAPDKETIYYIYVVNAERRLTGFLSLKDLILATPVAKKVREVAHPEVISVHVDDDQEDVARLLADYDFLAVPVVDSEQRLVGIVTFDDVIDVIEEEAEEDLYHMAGVSTEERVSTPALTSVRLRAGWLVINLGTAILAALTVSLFEPTIARYVVLAVMMPIVAGMGGNAGSQTMAVVVRGLALGEVPFRNSWKLILKEIAVGFANGTITGIIMAGIAILWYGNPWLGLIMLLAMIANLMIAGLFGAAFPLALKALKCDPALASTIFITTATDVGGFFVFLALATVFLDHLA